MGMGGCQPHEVAAAVPSQAPEKPANKILYCDHLFSGDKQQQQTTTNEALVEMHQDVRQLKNPLIQHLESS